MIGRCYVYPIISFTVSRMTMDYGFTFSVVTIFALTRRGRRVAQARVVLRVYVAEISRDLRITKHCSSDRVIHSRVGRVILVAQAW